MMQVKPAPFEKRWLWDPPPPHIPCHHIHAHTNADALSHYFNTPHKASQLSAVHSEEVNQHRCDSQPLFFFFFQQAVTLWVKTWWWKPKFPPIPCQWSFSTRDRDPYGSKAAFLMIIWHSNSVKWCKHNTNGPVLCRCGANTSWDEVNCMMNCVCVYVCPDTVLALYSQLARTHGNTQLSRTRSVWKREKKRLLLTAPPPPNPPNSSSWRSCCSYRITQM